MLQMCAMPIDDITQTSVWLSSPYAFLLTNDKCYQRAVQYTRNILVKFKYNDYLQLYSRPDCRPLFCALNGNIFDYYYDYDESLRICDELLQYQFADNRQSNHTNASDRIKEFLQTLYDILEKKRAKTTV